MMLPGGMEKWLLPRARQEGSTPIGDPKMK